MVERGATEVVGAEVETEAAMVETEAAAMVESEVGGATEETVVVVATVGTEVEAMEETGVAAAMEETEVAMEAKWEEGEYWNVHANLFTSLLLDFRV